MKSLFESREWLWILLLLHKTDINTCNYTLFFKYEQILRKEKQMTLPYVDLVLQFHPMSDGLGLLFCVQWHLQAFSE